MGPYVIGSPQILADHEDAAPVRCQINERVAGAFAGMGASRGDRAVLDDMARGEEMWSATYAASTAASKTWSRRPCGKPSAPA